MTGPAVASTLRGSGRHLWTDVTVTVNGGTLIENGWHHEDECPARKRHVPMPVTGALESLHRQAHPSQHPDPLLCREEPCRSLTIGQLRGLPS